MLLDGNTRCLNLLLNYWPEFKNNFGNIKRILENYSIDNCIWKAYERIFIETVENFYSGGSDVGESDYE